MEFSTYSVFNVEYLIAKIAEGRTIQYRYYRDLNIWSDYKPGSHDMPFSISNPHTWNTIVWRVKPEVKTIRYSVFLVRDTRGKTFVTTNHYFNPNTETIVKVIEEKEIEYEVE